MDIRNVAIIAHVDHGKTTLVDALLRQSKTKLTKEVVEAGDLIMDSNELERERGITIFSKNASVVWNGVKINIIDTPGHADFGGEVERVLRMADGCLLLIDAKDGPMPQTRFVLKKALELGLKIIVVINKIDLPQARIETVLGKTFDLFVELGADEATAFFPTIYASGKLGLAGEKPDITTMKDISYVFETIIKEIPAPLVDPNKPLQALITSTTFDNFMGRTAVGRIYNGKLTKNQEIMHINRDGEMKKNKLTSLMTFEGLDRVDTDEVVAGDIFALSGIPDITIGETIADVLNPQALPVLSIEEPTVKVTIMINSSPFAGREGKFTTSRQIQERLDRELEHDMALRVENGDNNNWIVSGRGELHLAILIERIRREGYEFQVSRPQVIVKIIDSKKHIPFERVFIEVPEEHSGNVMQMLGMRRADIRDIKSENGISFIEAVVSTREMFGFRGEFMTQTRGLGIMNTMYEDYRVDPGVSINRKRGSLVAHESGKTALYGLLNVQDRGKLFIGPGVNVYKGQVVGVHARENDLVVNVCKEKKLSNMRSKGDGVSEHFDTPKGMDLDSALEYIGDDELVEVTPASIRIRKKVLDLKDERKRELGQI